MTVGRGITNDGWINSSVDYNKYFKTHEKIGEVSFTTIDTDGKSPIEAAKCILKWMNSEV